MATIIDVGITTAIMVATGFMMKGSFKGSFKRGIEIDSKLRILDVLNAKRQEGLDFEELAGGTTNSKSRENLHTQLLNMSKDGMVRITETPKGLRYYLIPPP